jgi:nucleoside-triphosphatase
MREKRVLLLTGRPGVGKTTVVRKVAARLGTGHGQVRIAGFFTQEMRDGSGRRSGFVGETFGGRRKIIASVARSGGPRVSRYGVDVRAVEELTEAALAPRSGVDVYLVDEIGKMECLSDRFIDAIRALLDSGQPVVATVGLRGGGFIASVKRHPSAAVREVTRENRDALPPRIVDWLTELLVAPE